jgi:hypothetical protein
MVNRRKKMTPDQQARARLLLYLFIGIGVCLGVLVVVRYA